MNPISEIMLEIGDLARLYNLVIEEVRPNTFQVQVGYKTACFGNNLLGAKKAMWLLQHALITFGTGNLDRAKERRMEKLEEQLGELTTAAAAVLEKIKAKKLVYRTKIRQLKTELAAAEVTREAFHRAYLDMKHAAIRNADEVKRLKALLEGRPEPVPTNPNDVEDHILIASRGW